MTDRLSDPCTAFQGHDLLQAGSRLAVALAVKQATATGGPHQILMFEDATGRVVDLDLRGSDTEIADRLAQPPASPRGRFRPSADPAPATPKGRGRPKLGVVSREVTLLPRHWDWLATQKGGASAALRRLVDEARRQPDAETEMRRRAAREAAYTFMQAIAGDLPEYEDAIRALFANDKQKVAQHMAQWPRDVAAYALHLAFGAAPTGPETNPTTTG